MENGADAPFSTVFFKYIVFQRGLKGVIISTLDKQRICVNTQLKSSKKQLK